MSKNVIFFVIDSLLYTRLGNSHGYSASPFIDEKLKNAVFADNMYSEAPFTEAATIALLTSAHTLDNGGYLKKFKNQGKNIGELFEDRGYETFNNTYQPHVYPTSIRKGFSSVYYNVGFDINTLWAYRFDYFSNLYKENKLLDSDIEMLKELLEENFNGWILFLEELDENAEAIEFIAKNLEYYDAKSNLDFVKKEFDKFLQDKEGYLKNLLSEGKSHALFTVPDAEQRKITDVQWKENFIKKHQEFFNRSFKANKNFNLRNNRVSFKEIKNILTVKNISDSESNIRQLAKYMYNYKKSLIAPDFMDRIAINYDKFKSAPSLHTHLEHLKKWVSSRNEERSEQPYFALLHVDDVHSPAMFFSYDCTDTAVLDEEFEALEKFLASLPKNYKGSLIYDYSIIYMDLCIKRLVDWLKAEGRYDDTTIVITADHGFSFSYDPIRKNSVHNFYDENYRIPYIIFDKDSKYNKIEKFSSSVDIIPTLLDYLGLPEADNIRGRSLLDPSYIRDFIIIEYMGSGCPDLVRRDIRYCIRSRKFKIVYAVNVNNDFDSGKLLELYDLQKDPMNYTNIRDKFTNFPEAKDLLKHLKTRHEELQRQNRENNF